MKTADLNAAALTACPYSRTLGIALWAFGKVREGIMAGVEMVKAEFAPRKKTCAVYPAPKVETVETPRVEPVAPVYTPLPEATPVASVEAYNRDGYDVVGADEAYSRTYVVADLTANDVSNIGLFLSAVPACSPSPVSWLSRGEYDALCEAIPAGVASLVERREDMPMDALEAAAVPMTSAARKTSAPKSETVASLRQRCKAAGLTGYSKASRAELLRMLGE